MIIVLAREASLAAGTKDSATDPEFVDNMIALHQKYDVRCTLLLLAELVNSEQRILYLKGSADRTTGRK